MISSLRSSAHSLLTGVLVAILLAGSGSLAGCATIMSEGGGEREVHVTSTPEGASVSYRRGARAWEKHPELTPTVLHLDPAEGDGDYQLRLELEGYEPATAYLDSDLDPWFIGSVALIVVFVIPGVVATGVDLATGAWKKFEDDELHFDLRKAE